MMPLEQGTGGSPEAPAGESEPDWHGHSPLPAVPAQSLLILSIRRIDN